MLWNYRSEIKAPITFPTSRVTPEGYTHQQYDTVHYNTGAQKRHIVSLLGDVTSPTTVAHYVSMTCTEHREALTAAPTADGVHITYKRLECKGEVHSSPLSK